MSLRLASIALLWVLTLGTGCAATPSAPAGTVLITGSNRGIGLEFVRQYSAAGWNVIATARNPEAATELQALASERANIAVERLDITDATQVQALAERYRGKPIDILINNAALLQNLDRQMFGRLDYELFDRSFAVNTVGPMRVTEALIDNVAASRDKTIVTLTSAAAAHAQLRPPANLYQYRSSKAALNMLMHNLAIDLKPRGVRVVLVNPGLVDTRGVLTLKPGESPPEEFAMLMPLIRAGQIKLITPVESVQKMIRLISEMKPAQSGEFLNYDGQVLDW